MNLFLNENESCVKEWNFVEKSNNLQFQNHIVLTEKRFIYQKELLNGVLQKSVNRTDIGLNKIKAITASYGSTQGKLFLVLGIIGIILALLSVFVCISGGEIATGIGMLVIGVLMSIMGFYFHAKPEKCPIKVKKPNFTIKIETDTPYGSVYSFGAGQSVALKGRKGFNPFNLASINKDGIEIPEEIAMEVIESVGSLIF